ncbi:hypothetical protein RirG_162330 [Rhizophagus irregularis DAOM 197198w]|uniref:Uncharacterized protein n=1 Tax=Rhizophagus irregularis (strain DAOM 197198w) TaxID=1432141 RepID=A0A015J6H4_RHIIW|nr:hypothetical protein RirG_162330 [Rhizophagus irregularis DAOM 197198w]
MFLKGKFATYNGTITGEGRMYLCLSEKQGDIGDKQKLCFHVLSCICRRIGNKNQIKKIDTWARSGESEIVRVKNETRILLSSPDPSQYARDPQEENLEKARLILSHMKRLVQEKVDCTEALEASGEETRVGAEKSTALPFSLVLEGAWIEASTISTGRPKGMLEIRLEVGVEGEVILTFIASSETVHKRLFGTPAVLLGDKGQSSEGAEVSGDGDSGISGLITEGAGGVVIV